MYKGKKFVDGRFPIVLQYIIDRKVKRRVIYKCYPDDWDSLKCRVKSKVSNSAYINSFLSDQYAQAEQTLFNIQTGQKKDSDLFDRKKTTSLSSVFAKEAKRLKADMKAGSFNKLEGFRKQIVDFAGTDDLVIEDMGLTWFQRFASYLQNDLGNNGATTQKKIKTIRSLVSRYSSLPVGDELMKMKIPAKKPVKQKLSAEELKSLEELSLPACDLITATRDLFLMQVYLRGIRVGDLLQADASNFSNGIFSYVDDKTGGFMSIKLIPRAQTIVELYTGKSQKLFPFFKWDPKPGLSDFDNKRLRMKEKETCTSVVNKYLKVLARMAGIQKPLSSHIARHTFARMAIDKINNPMVTMELLGHSSLAVHQQYLNDIRKDDQLNQAADDIFG